MLGDFPLPSIPARPRSAEIGEYEEAVKKGSHQDQGKKKWICTSWTGRHTSDGKTLLPGFVGCFGISLEPQLSLGMDLIAVWLHCGEGLDGDILEEASRARQEFKSTSDPSSKKMALIPKE